MYGNCKGKVIKGMLATLTILGYHHIFIMNDLFVYQTTHIVQRKSRLGTWLLVLLSINNLLTLLILSPYPYGVDCL